MIKCKLYNKEELKTGSVTVNGKTYDNILMTKEGYILSGYDHFIGKDEKRRNDTVLHIEFPYNVGNYSMFYKGSQQILINACNAIEKILNGTLASVEKSELYKVIIESLHIVHHMNTEKRKSKLNGINSLSTSCCDNSFCLQRIKDNDSVCSHCYSNTQQKTQLALQDRNTINGIILRNIIIPTKYWKKYINPADLSKYFRIESFGDVANKTQAINYINFMKAFPRVHFAVWTKNKGIWHFAMNDAGKPDNMVFIVSSNRVNGCEKYHVKNDSRVDHVFTVYDKKYIAENKIKINCGGRACLECIKRKTGCYFRNTEKLMNEELK